MKNKLLTHLSHWISGFPVILNSQQEIFRAEQSGDLSFGMPEDLSEPKLPEKIRYILSFIFKISDSSRTPKIFFPYQSKTTWPLSDERILARQDTKDKLAKAIQHFKTLEEHSSALLRYIKSNINENVSALEMQARIELISLVVNQWNPNLKIDNKFLASLDTLSIILTNPLRAILFPNHFEFKKAQEQMKNQLDNNITLYHHSIATGVALWNAVKKLREEIYKSEFKQMIARGDWSPAGFLTQHKLSTKNRIRVVARKTDLGGILPYTIEPGKLVILNFRESAENSDGLFLHLCCGGDFVMDFLTLLVDSIYPGIRKIPDKECPYLKNIQRPLY